MATTNEYKIIVDKIDGKKSISIPVDFKKNGVYIPDVLDVIVRGFLKFEETVTQTSEDSLNELEDKTVVHPVVFSSDTIRISNGRCVIVLLPRSEDLFEETSTVQSRAGETITDSMIISDGGVRADEQITDPDKIPVVIKIETGVTRKPYKISLQVTVTSVNDDSFYIQTIDRGTSPKIEEVSASKSLFHKATARISSNLIINCETDLEWIPSVNSILGSNNGSQNIILDEIEKLKNSTPLGTSTMFDAVVAGDRILSDSDVNNSKKTIYLFTDNEANISVASIQNAIDETNDIDGNKEVPILVGNMAISDNATLSIKANRSDTKTINQLAFETGGQSITVADEDYLDDIVGIFYREAVGSMGYGTYEFINDFGEEVLINRISASFTIPSSDSNATWTIETSLDGYNYTAINLNYNSTDSVSFSNLLVRYIRFKIIMVTGISSVPVDEYGTTPATPSLESIEIVFNANKVAYLYLNKEDVTVPPYQITLGVDANEINDDQIKVGVAKSDAVNWNDYFTESQPTVDQNGKVVIPIRFSQDVTQFEHEPLRKIDNFATKTEYGRWDQNARVIIYDKNNAPMPTDYYNTHPREGRIVFNTALPSDYQDGDYKIGILNVGEYKVGLELTNKTETDTLDIYGIGYEYTTGKNLLPPVSKASPEVQQVAISNETPNRFSLITLTYIYFDSNFDPEDTSKRVITWYINGVPNAALNNMIQWNNINDFQDPLYTTTALEYPDIDDLNGLTISEWVQQQTVSLIKAGDIIHAEVNVSDGELLSDKGTSIPVTVIESVPVLTGLNIKGRDPDGNIISRIATNTDAIIDPPLTESFFSDSGGDNQSQIIWYVNDEIFKQGVYGDTLPEGQPPITEIRVNEIASGTLIDYGLRITNSIYVQVIPKTSSTDGALVTSPAIIVQNAIPTVFDLTYLTNVFVPTNDIILDYEFFDFEVIALGDVDETLQEDQTMVRWYRKNPGDNNFTLVYGFNDVDNGLQETFYVEEYRGFITTNIAETNTTVSKDILFENQKFYCVITPFDTIDYGTPVSSETVTITSSTN
jgi:hypothetical protein